MSLPVTILIDDPAPLVNAFWWHASATQNTDDPRQADGQRKFGLEATQVTLGHAKADVTQIYAERDLDKAASVM